MSATTPGQSGSGINSNVGVFYTSQSYATYTLVRGVLSHDRKAVDLF